MLARLCEQMGAEQTSSILYCESRWQSRANVSRQVFLLRDQFYQSLKEASHDSTVTTVTSSFIYVFIIFLVYLTTFI